MQGSANQINNPHGPRPMPSGNILNNAIPPPPMGAFGNSVSNIQGPNSGGVQNFQTGGMFNRPLGLNSYQVNWTHHCFLLILKCFIKSDNFY